MHLYKIISQKYSLRGGGGGRREGGSGKFQIERVGER